MSCCRIIALTLGVAALAGIGRAAEDPKDKNQCVLNAFAVHLGFTPTQKEQAAKIHSEFEQKAAPLCERIWTLYDEHRQAVMQILTPEQRKELPQVIKAVRLKMLETFSTKLGLNDRQKKQAEQICNEYAEKFQQLADHKDAKSSEKFVELKQANLEAFCHVLTDQQRVKLPALIQEELVSGPTPTAKSDMRTMVVEKLKLNTDQTRRLDKVCEDFSAKIDKEKGHLHQLWKEMTGSMEKVLTADQRKKFEELVKSTE
jgi:hypothetical protein